MNNYFDFKNNIDYKKLEEIAFLIKSGKLVIFPTETVYAIGTNGLKEDAVKKIYEVKKRNLKNPINLLVNGINMIEKLCENITPLEYKLMEAFFPGPFTIILNKKDVVPNIVTANSKLVGVRVPNNNIAIKLIEYANVPIVAPSANISGKISGTNIKNIINDFSNKVDCIIDGGQSDIGIESTIVRVIDNIPHILRPGFITAKQIEDICGKVIIENSNLPSKNLKHYTLNSESVLVYDDDENKLIKKVIEIANKYNNPAIFSTFEHIQNYKDFKTVCMGSINNLEDISKNLFTNLQKLDFLNADIIIIEGIPQNENNLSLAIMNRLKNL